MSAVLRDISRNVMTRAASLREAMERLNLGIDGVVLVVDEEGCLCGILTDGDIRRALLAGATPETPLAECMNRAYTAGRAGTDRRAALSLMSGRCRHLPLLDAEGRPVDLLSWSEIWRVAVSSPHLGGNELKYVDDCLVNGWISSQGHYVRMFEAAFAERLGIDDAITTTSGTTALHLGLVALGIGSGDEVIVPDITFGASANAVLQCGARPVFVDVDPRTWTLDATLVEAAVTPRTRAIMPVHLYGQPCDMDALVSLARRHGLRLVEDCAEALGATWQGQPVGTIGDVGCFSFFANKVITTGEGGMIVTRDAALAERIRCLRSHGMDPARRYWHLEPGFNYRMTNLQAAVGLAQLEQIERFLAERRQIEAEYDRLLADLPGVRRQQGHDAAHAVCWLYTIVVSSARDRDDLMARLHDQGIETRPLFPPLHVQPAFRGADDGDFPVSSDLAAHGLSLPTSNGMDLADVVRAGEAVRQLLMTTVVAS